MQANVAHEIEHVAGKRRREAQEEKVVAESLLCVDGDAIAAFGAQERRMLAPFAPPRVFGPGVLEAARDEMREREVEVRLRVARAKPKRLAIVLHRIRVTAALVVQRAHVVMRGGKRRVEGQRALEARERFVVAPHGLQGDAEVHVRDCEARVDLQGAREVRARFLVAGAVDRDQAQRVPRLRQRGIERYRLARRALRVVEAADALQRGREVRPAPGRLRRDGERHAQVRDGAPPIVDPRGGDRGLRVRGEVEGRRGLVSHVSSEV
jgi:hypothetical protein